MTPVIFRRWRWQSGQQGSVFALFPTLSAGGGYVTCYQHIGQHGQANYGVCVRRSLGMLMPDEYAELLAELRRVGYDDLVVYRRRQPWMRPG